MWYAMSIYSEGHFYHLKLEDGAQGSSIVLRDEPQREWKDHPLCKQRDFIGVVVCDADVVRNKRTTESFPLSLGFTIPSLRQLMSSLSLGLRFVFCAVPATPLPSSVISDIFFRARKLYPSEEAIRS
jgi:hypothetical protein